MADKVYTAEEIARIAPGYRGKPENFHPDRKAPRKPAPPAEKRRLGPKSPIMTPPGRLQTKSTPQRNHSLIAESIFGLDISVVEINPAQHFSTNFSKLTSLADGMYSQMRTDDKMLDRVFVREELSYYSTALMWLRLIDVKSKQGLVSLTTEERSLSKAVEQDEFNVPAPLFIYLNEIGSYTDQMGKETELEIPALPTTTAAQFGGYHAASITIDTHNLFEEVPSLGVAGDMLMALCADAEEPTPNFHVTIPTGTHITSNLTGKFYPIGPRRPEIRQTLSGYGITATSFAEYTANTRFNLKYVRHLSDVIGKTTSFKIDKLKLSTLTREGGETQAIATHSLATVDTDSWLSCSVQSRSASSSSTAHLGAACCFGFQLYKADGPGTHLRNKVANWSCIFGDEWDIPAGWNANKNSRRNLPPGIGTERFRGISIRQDNLLDNTLRRLVVTPR